jgi:hypothetical protein
MASNVSAINWNTPTGALSSGSSYYVNIGDEITITYSFATNGSGGITTLPTTDYVLLSNGAKAFYFSGNGTNAITFKYVVQPGDTASALSQTDTKIYTVAGSAEPNNVINSYNATSSTPTNAILVDTTAPTYGVLSVGLSADTGSSATDFITKTATQNITGTLTAALQTGDTVRVSLNNGTTWQTATATTGSTSFALNNVVLPAATNTLLVHVVDTAGNISATRFSHSYTLDTATPTPTVALSSDTGTSSTDGITGAKALSGTAEANSTVTIKEGTTTLGTATANSSGNWTFGNASATNGSHTYTVTATDAAGNTSTAASLGVTIDTATPTPTVALSSDTGTSSTDGITSAKALSGTAEANSTVTIKEGTTTLGTATADGAGNWTFGNASATNGSHTYTVTATDAAGNTSTAASPNITIDAAVPTAPASLAALDNVGTLQDPLGSGGRTDDTTPTLTGTAENGATIRIYLDGGTSPVATTTADASGTWSYTPPAALAEGSHSFTATATDVAGNISGSSTTFTVTVDTTLCYLEGAHILTPTGEVPIQYLKIGDMVVTRWAGIQPIKWIGRQSFSAQFVKANRAHIPVRIKAGALGDRLPARSLSVSPGHSMLVGDSLVLARSLVNGVTITQDETPGTINYFQVELETHDCVIAEGAWSETYADCLGQREQFHNAAEFEELYPDHLPPKELRLCAPRPERGAKLDEVLRPVVARASAGMTWGRLRGSIDRIAGLWKIEGWAQDPGHPELPVLLEVLLDDQAIGIVLACDLRKDLLKAGIGQGRCSFIFDSPVKILPELAGTLRIRRAADGAEIQMSADCKAAIQPGPVQHVGQTLRLVS